MNDIPCHVKKYICQLELENANLKSKLAAAQNYINLSECDPDITKEMWDAYIHYKTVIGEADSIGYDRFANKENNHPLNL